MGGGVGVVAPQVPAVVRNPTETASNDTTVQTRTLRLLKRLLDVIIVSFRALAHLAAISAEVCGMGADSYVDCDVHHYELGVCVTI